MALGVCLGAGGCGDAVAQVDEPVHDPWYSSATVQNIADSSSLSLASSMAKASLASTTATPVFRNEASIESTRLDAGFMVSG